MRKYQPFIYLILAIAIALIFIRTWHCPRRFTRRLLTEPSVRHRAIAGKGTPMNREAGIPTGPGAISPTRAEAGEGADRPREAPGAAERPREVPGAGDRPTEENRGGPEEPPASPKDAPRPLPRISFEKKKVDFGKLVIGQKEEYGFPFRNVGEAPLKIMKVDAGCGCAGAKISRKELQPGEEGQIAIWFDSTDRLGYQELHILVYSNDPREKDKGPNTTVLKLVGEVYTLFQILPGAAYFPSFIKGEEHQKRVTVMPLADEPLQVTHVRAPADYVRCAMTPLEENGKKGVSLMVKVLRHAPVGRLDDIIILKTTSKRQPTVRIPLIATITGEIVHIPEVLNFYEVERGLAREQLIKIMNLKGTGIAIVEIEYDADLFAVSPRTIIADRLTEVAVTILPTAPPGFFSDEIRIFLKDPRQPLIRVPVLGRVQNRLAVEPGAVYFRLPTGSESRTVPAGEIRHRRGEDFKVLALKTDLEGLEAHWRPLRKGHIALEMRLVPGKQPRRLKGHLHVKTDLKNEGEITIPIRGEVIREKP
jgi:hypothetical protein